jgi:hypothetical protein
MRQSSRTARRFTAGTLVVVTGALLLGLVVATDRGATTPSSLGQVAGAVGRVVRTGATTETATVTGGAAATGASAAALPDTSGSETILVMVGAFLVLCAAAAVALVRTSQRQRTH